MMAVSNISNCRVPETVSLLVSGIAFGTDRHKPIKKDRHHEWAEASHTGRNA
jgi:hypothetical protein